MKGFSLLFRVIVSILDSIAVMRREQRRLDHEQQRERIDAARVALLQQNTATAEARTAKTWNDVTLGDLKIEKERREMGLDAPEFQPKDYPPS